MKITESIKFKSFEQPVKFNGFEAIGYIPYEQACIKTGFAPARKLFSDTENKLPISDNKWVVIFRDTTNFGTSNFAIFFKDCFAVIGTWSDVICYDGKEITN